MESSSTLIVALVGAAVSLTVAYLGHRRSKTVDAVAAQSGAASNHRAGTEQVIKAQNDFIDQLQEELGIVRTAFSSRVARFEAETLEVARLRKKYGENGNDIPNPPTKEKT